MLGASFIRTPQASAFALALTACGAPPEPQASAPIGPAPVESVDAAQASTGDCDPTPSSEMGDQHLVPGFSDGLYFVSASAGALSCTPSGETVSGPVDCAVSGPAEVRFAGASTVYFHVAAGETAHLRVDGSNAAQCTTSDMTRN